MSALTRTQWLLALVASLLLIAVSHLSDVTHIGLLGVVGFWVSLAGVVFTQRKS